MRSAIVTSLLTLAAAHKMGLPINPVLGVPGFPDCERVHPGVEMTVEEAANDLRCSQKEAPAGAIRVACVGDSITAGVHSSGGIHPYPQQLQILLDAAHGEGTYSVTNLGACGSTMLKGANSPYWKRGQYTALVAGKWDIVTIMLGTNDAKDAGSHGPPNWQHNCGGPNHTTLEGCTFADDYKSMVELVRTLGTKAGVSPKIYTLIPPPLMALNVYGMNQTVINSVFPRLVPLIGKANAVDGIIDVYTGMGGKADWTVNPAWPLKCNVSSTFQPTCGYYCDAQSCDQCHPDDNGYANLATVLKAGLGL